MHYSVYNRIVELPDGRTVVYNLFSGHKLVLSGFLLALYNNIMQAPASKLAKKWLKLGFLAEGDERVRLRLQHYAAMHDTKHLGLTICPTRGCNFRCPYCFEEHLSGGMSEEVQAKLVAFVQKYVEENHPKTFSVSWFGGEPLLYPQIIEHLSTEFINLCDAHAVEYKASIVTNGYFFTPENVTMLEAARVGNVQITLDGPKEQNDQTRILADGSGSYEVIMGNLRTVRTTMKIIVRCNTSTENRASYDELKQTILALREETGNKISSYPAYMDAAVAVDKDKLTKHSLNYDGYLEKEFSSSLPQRLEELRYRPCPCTAQFATGFVVRDDGTLCKCWNDVTRPECTVASLLEDSDPLKAQLSSEWGLKYLGLDIFDIAECRECILLPLCSGGCPAKRLEGRPECFKSLIGKLDDLIAKSVLEPEQKKEK